MEDMKEKLLSRFGWISLLVFSTALMAVCFHIQYGISLFPSEPFSHLPGIKIPEQYLNVEEEDVTQIEGYHRVTSSSLLLDGVNLIITRNNSEEGKVPVMKINTLPADHYEKYLREEENDKLILSDEDIINSSFLLSLDEYSNRYTLSKSDMSKTYSCLSVSNLNYFTLSGNQTGYITFPYIDSTGKTQIKFNALDPDFKTMYVAYENNYGYFMPYKDTANVRTYIDTYSLFNSFGEVYLHYSSYKERRGMCTNYYPIAKSFLLSLSEEYVNYFINSSDAHITELRQRYESWARSNKDSSPYFL